MMDKKIIYLTGGKFNRRKLISYSKKTRPTSQKVRLAVFNSLFNISGNSLDLFAGSGAYTFEALSRGLNYAYLNDDNYLAIKSIKENANSLNVADQIEVTRLDYMKALNYYEENNILFDVVFIDPPFNFNEEELLKIFDHLNKTQKKGLRVVVETTSSSSPLNVYNFDLIFNKQYGSKRVFIYQK